MLIDHRGAQISVSHYVENERWILSLPSRTCQRHVERGKEQCAWKSQLLLAPLGTGPQQLLG